MSDAQKGVSTPLGSEKAAIAEKLRGGGSEEVAATTISTSPRSIEQHTVIVKRNFWSYAKARPSGYIPDEPPTLEEYQEPLYNMICTCDLQWVGIRFKEIEEVYQSHIQQVTWNKLGLNFYLRHEF